MAEHPDKKNLEPQEPAGRGAVLVPFTLRSMLIRLLFILIIAVVVCLSMATAYGPWQAIGAVMSIFLVLAAVRKHRIARVVLAILAAMMLGLTLLGTQSAYQYARWHADEIVAAGCELMDRCPKTDYHTYNRHPEIDTSGVLGLLAKRFSRPISVSQGRFGTWGCAASGLTKSVWPSTLGQTSSTFRVSPSLGSSSRYTEFRIPRPHATLFGATKGRAATRITDRLWTNIY